MALLVVLLPAGRGDLPLGSAAVEALARLGVTSVSLARAEHTAAVILEGWAFDPSRPDAALDALGASRDRARALQPIAQMAVTTRRKRRRTDPMRHISALLAVAAVIALAVFAGSASATPSPTPNGWAGACNMLQDPTMPPGSGGPMDKDNPNGNAGMFRAVSVSDGNCG